MHKLTGLQHVLFQHGYALCCPLTGVEIRQGRSFLCVFTNASMWENATRWLLQSVKRHWVHTDCDSVRGDPAGVSHTAMGIPGAVWGKKWVLGLFFFLKTTELNVENECFMTSETLYKCPGWHVDCNWFKLDFSGFSTAATSCWEKQIRPPVWRILAAVIKPYWNTPIRRLLSTKWYNERSARA